MATTQVPGGSQASGFHPEWHLQPPVNWRDTDLDADTLREWLYLITLGRQLDYRFQVLNRQGRAPFIISCAGHEAAQVGAAWPLRPGYDWVAPYYRDVVLALRIGITPYEQMLAVLAKPEGRESGGKQTPGHYSDRSLNVISNASPVTTQMVHAAGAAYALKNDGTDRVVLTCYGEGSGSEGDVHEAFNFAAIYKLPVIFFCQNNGFAISTPFRKNYAIDYAAQRAAGYGFPGVTVDGRDPVTVYHVARQAIARARAGEGPTLIEAIVDRLGAHSSEDDQRRYRTQEEIEALARNDCLVRFRSQLLAEGIVDEQYLAQLDERVKQEVTEATQKGMAAREAEPEEALTNVYAPSGQAAARAPEPGGETVEVNMVQAIRDALHLEMKRDQRGDGAGRGRGPERRRFHGHRRPVG